MQIPANTIYPRSGDRETVYLRAVVTAPSISVGEDTIYNDCVRDPREFEPFPSSTRRGTRPSRRSRRPGTTGGTLSSAAMSGSAMRPSSSPACGSVTAPLSPPGRW